MSDVTGPADSLRYRFLGMSFASPIVLLSGCVGFGEEYTRVEGFSNTDCGAVVLKGTTLEPRLGNPPHRVFETPMGMLNAIGLQNPGTDHVVKQILPTLDFSETRFIANVSGSTIEEYAEVTRRFDDSPIDAIEINISCPNVKEGGVAFGIIGADTHHRGPLGLEGAQVLLEASGFEGAAAGEIAGIEVKD